MVSKETSTSSWPPPTTSLHTQNVDASTPPTEDIDASSLPRV
jgi:hypothetical protein